MAGNGLGGAMPLNKSTTYHAPPPCFKNFYPTYMLRSDYRVEAVILCHVCQAMKPPPPLLGSLPPPPPDPAPPPPRPANGPRVGGSRRMARCYAPPVPGLHKTADRLNGRCPPGFERTFSKFSRGCSTTGPMIISAERLFPFACSCRLPQKKAKLCVSACLFACLLA